ncbi:DUF1822 family protein [Romeriopsis navalis]|nr:DUF1822 family protein [Romeriopsis navalis]
MYSRPNPTDPSFDYEPLQGEIVPLKEDDFLQAQQISQRWVQLAMPVQQRWAIYLHALALRGFQLWFNQRTTPHSLDLSQTFVLLPDAPHAQQQDVKGHIAVCQIQVASFKICLVVTDGSADDWCIPSVAIQNPHIAAHFYLPIVVHEESGQVEILGFLQHNQIAETTAEGMTEDYYYRLALVNTNPELERLLLYLTCLEPVAIPLPEANVAPVERLSQRGHQLLLQPVVRTGQWLNKQVNTVADQLGNVISTELSAWQVLPSLELANTTRSGLRDIEADSPMGDLSAIMLSLMRGGMQIPLEQTIAYQDLQLADLSLRLYVVTAPQATDVEPMASEWSLLAILRQQDQTDLPGGVGLQIADVDQVLVEQQTNTEQSDFLYGSVIGGIDEQFILTVSCENQVLTLPPFSFE